MQHQTVALNDYQVALIVNRGSSMTLSLMQEEFTEENQAVVAPAKSFSLTQRDAVIALRDLLNKALGEDEHE